MTFTPTREDYDWWQARLSRRLANGLFGETLTIGAAGHNAANRILTDLGK